ncbi:MAG: hypothetical protein A3K19_23065 [Lentisphaerae bacterium RIFOXYB12_FULL_65_16]|nr:MAG: hypothetical protein A3K18_14235 [Lentisphaerae bacterium RIFOXYA12_64_32]OGV84962.1 MAG: hypothetical protein A3K19_23065 [Lentisphaerae bacterium RIFOXYB12_FULL_65_16]
MAQPTTFSAAMLLLVFTTGCATSYREFTLDDGTSMRHEFRHGRPASSRTDTIEVEEASFDILLTDTLRGRYRFELRTSHPCISRIGVYRIEPGKRSLFFSVIAPEVKNGLWQGLSSPRRLTEENFPWSSRMETTTELFQIEIETEAGSRDRVYQPVSVPWDSKFRVADLRRHLPPAAAARLTATVVEPWRFEFDGRTWIRGYDSVGGEGPLIEYVLDGESVESWSELVTSGVAALPAVGNASEDALDLLLSETRARLSYRARDFRWSVIERGPGHALYEWSHQGCPTWPPQHEIARCDIAGPVVVSLRYTVNTARTRPTQEGLDFWRSRLRTATTGTAPGGERPLRVQADRKGEADSVPPDATLRVAGMCASAGD